MLGRLGLDVDQCIEAYERVTRTVFPAKQSHSLRLRSSPLFDQNSARAAFESVVQNAGLSTSEAFDIKKAIGSSDERTRT